VDDYHRTVNLGGMMWHVATGRDSRLAVESRLGPYGTVHNLGPGIRQEAGSRKQPFVFRFRPIVHTTLFSPLEPFDRVKVPGIKDRLMSELERL
jgi:hypothetical protein